MQGGRYVSGTAAIPMRERMADLSGHGAVQVAGSSGKAGQRCENASWTARAQEAFFMKMQGNGEPARSARSS